MKLELGFVGYGEEEKKEVQDCLSSTMLTMGQKVGRFEEMFAEYVGARHAIMVNSGSSANLLAVSALVEMGVWAKGDRVQVPALTWATTLWPLVQNGLVAELRDCDPRTLQTALPGTSSFGVHILGNASPAQGTLADCCEALGVFVNGKHVGHGALVSTFSFYVSHHITTGEGGMVTTDNTDLADVIRSMRSHGWTRGTSKEGLALNGLDPRFLFIHSGYNLRPMEMQAAFGIHQLPKLDAWNKHRREVFGKMRAALAPLGLFQFMEQTSGSLWAPFAFPVLVNKGLRNDLAAHLEERGIQTRPVLAGNLAAHPAVLERKGSGEVVWDGILRHADRVQTDGLYWGCHPGVDDAQIEYLVEAIELFASKRLAA